MTSLNTLVWRYINYNPVSKTELNCSNCSKVNGLSMKTNSEVILCNGFKRQFSILKKGICDYHEKQNKNG